MPSVRARLLCLPLLLALLGAAPSPPAPAAPSWPRFDALVGEQKLSEANRVAAALEQRARAESDDDDLARALVRETQLGIALGGYETAVETLAAKELPADPLARSAVELYQAQALLAYLDAYGWEIGQRERVVSGEALDLKLWTRDQITAAADRAFADVWNRRQALGAVASHDFEYLRPNNYPPAIRPSLRDAVGYLWADRLVDTSHWSPAELQERGELDLGALLDGAGVEPTAERLGDAALHPLVKMASILGDLERWHRGRDELGAALEARLERARLLAEAYPGDVPHTTIRAALRSSLPEFRQDAWWSMGMARLAAMERERSAPDALIRAHEIASAGEHAFPGSPGAAACFDERQRIEAPSFSVGAMTLDAPGRRSILIHHQNLSRLFLRAFRLERPLFEQRVHRRRSWGEKEIRAQLARSPAASWRVDLAGASNFRSHRTFTEPPLSADGTYLVVASPDSELRSAIDHVSAFELRLSELVLLHEGGFDRDEITLYALRGSDGTPLAGAEATLFRTRWEALPERLATLRTDADGRVRFGPPRRGGNPDGIAVVVRAPGIDGEAVWEQDSWPWRRRGPAAAEDEREPALRTLFFTDRAIYRPGQRLLWKTLTYLEDDEGGSHHAATEQLLHVRLLDSNQEVVAESEVTSNAFGTASGSFEIPAGRRLGNWRLEVDDGGSTAIQVEEYKRPTFEVTFEAPAEEPRLGQRVTLPGEARYYFGLPVAAGRIRWRVHRSSYLPLAWRGWAPPWVRPDRPLEIASGESAIGADGTFSIAFNAEGEPEDVGGCSCYIFSVAVDVTDEGGETRSAYKLLHLGRVTIQLALDGSVLVDRSDPDPWTLRRLDLDEQPRAGVTHWRIVELEQPAATRLPADLPVVVAPEAEPWATPGDRLAPRWAPAPSVEDLLARWSAGPERAHGTLEHGNDGRARFALPSLAPGAYRLLAETRDAHGDRAQFERAFVVFGGSGSAQTTPLAVPLDLRFSRSTAEPGGNVALFVHSGLPGQAVLLEISRGGRIVEHRWLVAGRDPDWISIPVGEEDRGGIAARAAVVADHQIVQRQAQLSVPWTNKQLTVGFETFRDRLEPGQNETYRVTVRGANGHPVGAGSAELVASMYDRSLDFFRQLRLPVGLALFPTFSGPGGFGHSLGTAPFWSSGRSWRRRPTAPSYSADRFVVIDPYGIGGPGARDPRQMMRSLQKVAEIAPGAAPAEAALSESITVTAQSPPLDRRKLGSSSVDSGLLAWSSLPPVSPRSNFAETAFWQPHLVTDATGSVAIEFRVPESLTSWRVWASAWTRELASGWAEREATTSKRLMVRPYLPRFLREGDEAELSVVVQNGGEEELDGTLRFEILDAESREEISSRFGLPRGGATAPFTTAAGGSANLRFRVQTPDGVRPLAVRVTARAGDLSDGELRPLPVLPARVRLVQSRFAALHPGETRKLTFDDMRRSDPTRRDEQLVVTVDGQLFYSMLDALPYLVDYPYECTEQTMNRFLSTAILQSMFDRYPAVAKMASELARRETRWERFDAADPNRRMALEETPWPRQARGSDGEDEALLRVLDPRVARAERADALAKLEQAQLPSGGFPWFPGGPPSPHMTLYLMAGFARAAEFGADVPEVMVRRGWGYLGDQIEHDWWQRAIDQNCCWELLTFANYVASSYPDPSVLGDVLPVERRREILDWSFAHWKQHAPLSKLQLALTLARMDRPADARLVLDSIMDSAKTDPDLGTYWAPEDRSWLWYNDATETHAWALRALSEIAPEDPRRDGLVQWLFLQKKLGHWKSTRATSEVLYSLTSYLRTSGTLATREEISIDVGGRTTDFVFSPDRFTGKKNQVVLAGGEIVPRRDATTVVHSRSRALAFASATWRFSTTELPPEARGDLFHVERRWFRRSKQGPETTLAPLAEGERLAVGDELEVQLSIRARAAAEYVHLRDPRPAGLEPDRSASGWRWETGLAYYEETRDSGTNFFFEALPAGEFTLRYRLRAATAGTFRAAPAELQSIYAPEFNAYSAGARLAIVPTGE